MSADLKQCSNKANCVHPEAVDGWLPETAEYYAVDKRKRKGLCSRCKKCRNEAARLRHAADPEKARTQARQRYAADPEKMREYQRENQRQRRAANPERARERRRQRYAADREKGREYARLRRAADREKIREQQRQRRAADPEKAREYDRQWRAANPEKMRERGRIYGARRRAANPEKAREQGRIHNARRRAANPEKVREQSRINGACRRARKRGLPDTFTAAERQRAIDYFHGCCAICGRQLNDLFHTHTAADDHWIPLTDPRPDNPGTVAVNMIPMCHGENGCNNRKYKRDPVEFVTTEFGKRKAKQILARIEAFFATVRQV